MTDAEKPPSAGQIAFHKRLMKCSTEDAIKHIALKLSQKHGFVVDAPSVSELNTDPPPNRRFALAHGPSVQRMNAITELRWSWMTYDGKRFWSAFGGPIGPDNWDGNRERTVHFNLTDPNTETQTPMPVLDESASITEYGTILLTMPCADAHAFWAQRGDPNLVHPLAPLVEAAALVKREVAPYSPAAKGSIPRFSRVGDDIELEVFPVRHGGMVDQSPHRQLDMLPMPAGMVKTDLNWLVRLYQAVGGDVMRAGKGAPWPLHLFIGALINTEIDRRDDDFHFLTVSTEDVIQWLHPSGWENRRRDWAKLPAALKAIRNGLNAVSVPGVGSVQVMSVPVIPERPSDPFVQFMVRVPETAGHGIPINWPRLCEYRTRNAPIYCSYLSAMSALDASARRGIALTRTIGDVVLGDDGEPRRKRGGVVVRDHTKQVANPSAKYAKVFTTKDLALMAGMNPEDRKHRMRARHAFEVMADEGVIDLFDDDGKWRIFGPRRA